MNPYLILGVPRDADDQRIRRAYLEGIKEATPETNPERFKALASAYEKIKDERSRHKYELLNTEVPGESPADAFFKYVKVASQPAPLSMEALREFLRSCSKI